jgi:hypothetical protein
MCVWKNQSSFKVLDRKMIIIPQLHRYIFIKQSIKHREKISIKLSIWGRNKPICNFYFTEDDYQFYQIIIKL